MSLLVISEPSLSQPDRDWIEDIRRRNDPQAGLVSTHFTLVFPEDGIGESALVAHARAVASTAREISFCLGKTVAYNDSLTRRSYAFLIPDEGFADIVGLHDQLYAGPLAGAQRHEVPFVPHITIGASSSATEMSDLVSRLKVRPINISGSLTSISIVRYDGIAVTTLDRVALA